MRSPRWALARKFTPTLRALIEAIAREARAGDQIVVMSNGGFGGIQDKLLARLARKP